MEGQGVVDMDHPRDYNGGKGILNRVMANPWASFAQTMGIFHQTTGIICPNRGVFGCLMGYFRQSRRMDCFSLRGRCRSGMMRRRYENSYRQFLLLLCRLRLGDHQAKYPLHRH